MHQLLNATRIKTAADAAQKSNKEAWLSDDVATRGTGRLVLRVVPNGTHRFYFRVARSSGVSPQVIPIGPYWRTARPGYFTLNEARLLAFRLASGQQPKMSVPVEIRPHGFKASSTSTWQGPAQSLNDVVAPTPSGNRETLLELCEHYCQLLEDDGRKSAKDIKSMVRCHIAPSKWAHLTARDINAMEFTSLLRTVVANVSGHTAKKVRSILHAAYARASSSTLDPTASQILVNFGIETNPIAGIDSLSQYSKVRNRVLRDSEFSEILRRIAPQENSSIALRALRLCILLGGQRGEQMLSVKLSDVDLEDKTILLLDPKGRRKTPRLHILPLCPKAEEEVRWLVRYADSVKSIYLFPGSISGTACNQTTVSQLVHSIRSQLERDGITKEPFSFIDFRRTIETKLASLGVSQDYRAQIQSHGLGGIQYRHYDRHDYMKVKRETLMIWEQHLSSFLM